MSLWGVEKLQRSMLLLHYHVRVEEVGLGDVPGMLALP